MENQMICYQCQETAGGKGCTAGGMCGKKPATAHLQDVLIYVTKGLAELATACRREGHAVSSDVTHMLEDNLFVTIRKKPRKRSVSFCRRIFPFLKPLCRWI